MDNMTAGDLLEIGMCTAQCLLALGDDADACTCRCNGRWHGTVTQVEIPGTANATRWYERHCYYGQMILDVSCPAIRPQQKHKVYEQAKRDRRAVSAAIKRGSRWETWCDTITCPPPNHQLPAEAGELYLELVKALMRAGRIRSAGGGKELAHAYGVATQVEAQVIGTIFCELLVGKYDGARSCLTALDEDGFVQEPYRTSYDEQGFIQEPRKALA